MSTVVIVRAVVKSARISQKRRTCHVPPCMRISSKPVALLVPKTDTDHGIAGYLPDFI